jgi:hypothetical protein
VEGALQGKGMNKLLLIFLLAMSSSLFGQSKLPPCQGTNVKLWHMCTGTSTSASGNKYVGEFHYGDFNGQGTFTGANGNKHIGAFKDDYPNRQGTFIFATGDKYVGNFKDDMFNGRGTFIWARGDKYVGEFKDDKSSGQGTATFANGAKYVGEFKGNKINGQGTVTYPSGDKYVGNLKDGERNGLGTYTWTNGDKYVGEFKDNKRNGQGTFSFANGDKYVGEYKDNKPHGIGTEVGPTGGVLKSGRWADGIFLAVVTTPVTATTSNQSTLAERAKQGNAQAQFDYGMTFISATNVEVQPRIALKWFSEAAKQGHVPAQKQIDSMFDLGARMLVMESPIKFE